VVLTMVLLGNIGSDGTRSLGGVVTKKGIVSTLDKEGVKFSNLLSTNPQLESGGIGSIRGEEAIGVGSNTRDESVLNPEIAEKITLGTNWHGNLIGRSESADVVHTLGLHREVSMALIILTEKTDLRLASDVYILSTFRNKVNQSS